ncbi:MAG: phosphate/phosphite/phosphonate ABC transporter substrate-binding protein [Acidobacteriota bacterium]
MHVSASTRTPRYFALGASLRRTAGWGAMAALVLALSVTTACSSGESEPAVDVPEGWPTEVVLGLVPAREANVLIDNAQELEDFLEEALGVPVRSFVPQDYTGLVEAMGSGQAHIGLIPPFAAMLGKERFDFETVLVSVRKESITYYSQWMTTDTSLCPEPPVRDEYGILTCEAPISVIEGKRVGFTDPASTSGYLFPALQLVDAGIDPDRDIQPIFLGGHDAAVIGVYNGDVEISVAYDGAQLTVAPEIPEVVDEVIVIHRSEPIPNDGVTLASNLPQDLRDAITQAFLDFSAGEADKPQEERVLWQIYEIDGFEPYPPGFYDTVERAFTELRDKIDAAS